MTFKNKKKKHVLYVIIIAHISSGYFFGNLVTGIIENEIMTSLQFYSWDCMLLGSTGQNVNNAPGVRQTRAFSH